MSLWLRLDVAYWVGMLVGGVVTGLIGGIRRAWLALALGMLFAAVVGLVLNLVLR